MHSRGAQHVKARVATASAFEHPRPMQPRTLLGSYTGPDATVLTLHAEAGGFVVRVGNQVLMSSRMHGSEQAMAAASLEAAMRRDRPRVLIGGLGMGYGLRAALDVLPRNAE